MEESKKYKRMVKQTFTKNNNKRGHGTGSGSGSRLLRVKVRKLQILIPGGKRCNHPDLLLSKTVDYIVHLKLKIRILKALSDMYSL
ncbi:transcription factor IBH1-like 1 [Raphanus sativus]|uniref:Transcription factor IBH1-like 1 n=1 Tax=Raphanus sativus TaxID=3726 RepID=A0A6J0M4N3_RAPSA|nr:transcription factor IBH1-like 1 [Raphanus sativus]